MQIGEGSPLNLVLCDVVRAQVVKLESLICVAIARRVGDVVL